MAGNVWYGVFAFVQKILDKGTYELLTRVGIIYAEEKMRSLLKAENVYWADRKKNVVDRFDKSSMYVEELFHSKGKIFERDGLLNPEFFQATGGAVPIEVEGFGVAGTIAISGLTSEDDHDLCIYGLKSIKELKNEL